MRGRQRRDAVPVLSDELLVTEPGHRPLRVHRIPEGLRIDWDVLKPGIGHALGDAGLASLDRVYEFLFRHAEFLPADLLVVGTGGGLRRLTGVFFVGTASAASQDQDAADD